MTAFIKLTQKGYQRWRKGHPWIFRNDLSVIEAKEAGAIEIRSPHNTLLGQGIYSPLSKIAVRELTRQPSRVDIKQVIAERIEHAYKTRQKIFRNTAVYRFVFAEADGLPSLIIDRYEQVLVFQTLSAGMEVYKPFIIEKLIELIKPESIIERNDAPVRRKEGLLEIKQCVYGQDFKEVEIKFNRKKFLIQPLEGQKTGFFLDQRFNAEYVAQFAHGKFLDAFCHSGQFSIQSQSFVQSITALDISKGAIDLTKKNFQVNQVENFELIEENAFDFLKKQDEKKEHYDTIILDPPAFVKHRASLDAAKRGYKEINLRALKLLSPGGILATFTCSQNISWEVFKTVLNSAALDAKKKIQVLSVLQQPMDHPQLLSMSETEYLKGLLLCVVH